MHLTKSKIQTPACSDQSMMMMIHTHGTTSCSVQLLHLQCIYMYNTVDTVFTIQTKDFIHPWHLYVTILVQTCSISITSTRVKEVYGTPSVRTYCIQRQKQAKTISTMTPTRKSSYIHILIKIDFFLRYTQRKQLTMPNIPQSPSNSYSGREYPSQYPHPPTPRD